MPYGHVTPADVGVTIGPGVLAPYPTEVYTGPMPITTPGTTIENKIINGFVGLYASNITLRNVVINNSVANHTVRINENEDSPVIDGVTIENSLVSCMNEGKLISARRATNVTIRNNELTGCLDFGYMQLELDGFLAENELLSYRVGSANGHSDGFQIGSRVSPRIR